MGRASVILIALILFLAAPVTATELNSDSELQFKDVLANGYAEAQTTLTTDSPSLLPVTISAAGPIENWISFESSSGFFISRDMPLNLRIIVEPPANTQKGVYTGYVVVSVPEEGNEITTSTFSNEVSTIKVIVEITDTEIKDLSVYSITLDDAMQGSPILFNVEAENKGNVIAKPTINIEILDSDENVIKSQQFSSEELLATQKKNIELQFPSEGISAGNYFAKVSVFSDGYFIKQATIPFRLFEKGTTTLSGKFVSFEADNITHVDSAAYITGVFENTGQVSLSAKLKADIYLGDTLIQQVESNTKIIPPGEKAEFTAYFIPDAIAVYNITSYVVYNGQKSETKETLLSAKSREMPLGFGAVPILLIILAGIVLWHFAKYPVKRKKKPKLFFFSRR